MLCVWVCLRLSLKLCWAISAMSTKEMTVWFLVSKDAYLYLAVRVHSRVTALGPTWCWKIKADGEGKSSVWPKSRRLVSPERDTVSLFLFLTHTHTSRQTSTHTRASKLFGQWPNYRATFSRGFKRDRRFEQTNSQNTIRKIRNHNFNAAIICSNRNSKSGFV